MFRRSKAKLSRLPPGYWRHLCHKQPYIPRSHRRLRPSNRYLLGSDANSLSASQALTALVLHSKLQSSCPDTALVVITYREPLPTALTSQPGPPHQNLTGTCATITHNGRTSEPSPCEPVQPQAIVEWIRPLINLGNDGYIEEDLRDVERSINLSIDHLLTYVKEVSARERALSGQEASLRSRETEIDRLQATIANENTKLDNANKALRRGRSDFDNEIASSFHAEVGPVTAALDKLHLRQTSGNKTQDSLREQVSSTQAALTTAQCSVSSLEQKLSNLRNTIVPNEIAMTEYSKQLRTFEAKQLADSMQINDLQRELGTVKADLSSSKELQDSLASSKASDRETSNAAYQKLQVQNDSLRVQHHEVLAQITNTEGRVCSLEQEVNNQKDVETSLRLAYDEANQRAQKTDEANKAVVKNASAVETKMSALLEIAHTTLQCTNSDLEDRVALLDSLVEIKGINVQGLQQSIKRLQDQNRQLKEKAVGLSQELKSTRAETTKLAPTTTTYQAPQCVSFLDCRLCILVGKPLLLSIRTTTLRPLQD